MQENSILELQTAMKEGVESARSITEAFLSRIEALDQAGPGIQSVIEINPLS